MIDVGSVMIIAASYAASLIAKQAADDLARTAWDRLKRTAQERLGRPPGPADLQDGASGILSDDSDLTASLEALFRSSSALRRASQVQEVFRGAEVLFCDDQPSNIGWEATIMAALGARTTVTLDNAAASAAAQSDEFDVVISDIDRHGRPDGLELPRLLSEHTAAPIVFYVDALDRDLGTPNGAFGIANHPADLLHLVCDILERRRF